MKVLVVGSGGREHALCWAIARSPMCDALYCAPGNGGIAEVALCSEVAADDIDGLVALAMDLRVDFVVIGPEAPLIAGIVDRLEAAGIGAFGPTAAAAALEGSKAFMKDLCAKYGIPTARYARFDEPEEAKQYIYREGTPIVVKADGLAGGKGVVICRNENEAYAAIDHILVEGAFGTAGSEVVIEEFLEGEELSFFALVNGTQVLPLASAQDHKAAFDGDQGPNTGGMGAYSPPSLGGDELGETILRTVLCPTVEAMAAEGRPYTGLLYAGLMMTASGPKLLEYNVRFGDPECQPLLMRLESDVLEALLACREGRLDEVRLRWSADAALTVVMATKGYPGPYCGGSQIRGLDRVREMEDVVIFHAATRLKDGQWVADGGRVLGVTARGASVDIAQRRVYEALAIIDWPEGFYRRDIGWRALKASTPG